MNSKSLLHCTINFIPCNKCKPHCNAGLCVTSEYHNQQPTADIKTSLHTDITTVTRQRKNETDADCRSKKDTVYYEGKKQLS